jgi:multidrug efflux system outer membrane protein
MKYGSVNYLQVIVARQSLLTSQLNVLSDRYNEIDSYISLYQALGGGVK